MSVPLSGARVPLPSGNGPDGLLAIAHGSRDPRHAAALRGLVDAVRSARPDLAVEVGFLDLCGPDVSTALSRLATRGTRCVAAVPLFLARGFHVRHDVPAALALARGALRQSPPVRVTACLGPDPLLLDALTRRLHEAGEPAADTVLVLASAGSSDPAARAEINRTAGWWSAATGREVVCSYASALAPTTGAAIEALRARGAGRIAVAPFFLAPGRLPDRVREDAHDAGVTVAAPLTVETGPCPELIRLLLDRHASARGAETGIAA